ncbi:MAG TPA: hypothetical protein ENK52_03275 [Saprospiraceae bacterium]|nr:hypothetical protein [Saprospiraceae bacterium]
MCTVSYVPTAKNEFILSSNRDEAASRSPQNISHILNDETQLLFPRDTAAGGTWIVATNRNQVVCLLNGAFEKHQHLPPYRRSRGLMVLDFFAFKTARQFFHHYELEGMEPFTFIVYDDGELFEFRWDGKEKYLKELNIQKAHVWSSATLYPKAIREKRAQWFWDWYEQSSSVDLKSILHLHKNGGNGDPRNDYVMNRDGKVQTLSITLVIKKEHQIEMQYHDLLRKGVKTKTIDLAVPVSFHC